jgi:hypothetical protein
MKKKIVLVCFSSLLLIFTSALWIHSYWFPFALRYHRPRSVFISITDLRGSLELSFCDPTIIFKGVRRSISNRSGWAESRYITPRQLELTERATTAAQRKTIERTWALQGKPEPTMKWGASVRIPIWFLWLISAAIFMIALVRLIKPRRLDGPQVCGRCSYSLTGNTSGVCPECGTAVNFVAASPES